MNDNIGKFLVFNGDTIPISNFNYIFSTNTKEFYEVIRIIKRVPLFFEEHYMRFKQSLKLMDLELPVSAQQFKKDIIKLLETNSLFDCNVKIVFYIENDNYNYIVYVSKSYYPSQDEIQAGVKVGLFNWERDIPNAKIINNVYKEKVSSKITQENLFEVLLVNGQNKITEGSKSNVFFVKGQKVFTTPGEYVLKGITRKFIIDTCFKQEFEVIETLIDVNSLCEMEGIFISGTSIKVLPVSMVDTIEFQSSQHPTIEAIRNSFDKLIEDYILKNC